MTRPAYALTRRATFVLAFGAIVGCARGTSDDTTSPASSTTSGPTPDPTTSDPTPTQAPTETPTEPAGPQPSDGAPQDALLTIPVLDIVDLPVEAYEGFTDDAPGTDIQNGGIAASPHGPRGGTGPGGIGNYQVTAHRLSSTRAFEFLPDMVDGDVALVSAGGVTYTYTVVDTRITSFRSEASLAEQRAAVPGQPGVEPTEAMITLSTCRTTEDRAEGNYWSDEFGNPENRVDKIGVLTDVSPTAG